MSVVPGDLETDHQPPMTVPLRHFLVGLGFLLVGGLVGIGRALDVGGGYVTVAHLHLLLAGWVCVTIMGAMTQFVPVWSGVTLHSRRLASAQLWLVAFGLGGFSIGLVTGWSFLLPAFGIGLVFGFWVFIYNIGRTLATLDGYDVTERHFGIALGFFGLLTVLGYLLAVDLVRPVFETTPITRGAVVQAHATLAVFGAVLTTVLGALYQLGTMFTQTDLHGIDRPLRRIEEGGYPIGVALLAGGRLASSPPIGRLGGVLVLAGLVSFGAILARRLYETHVGWTPMLTRYAVLPPAIATWALLTTPAWIRDPTGPAVIFGASGTVHLLTLGVIGFVVLGTLYHVVPFIVWVHRYSDQLGYGDVPMIDDLYSDRLATIDLGLFLVGSGLVVGSDWFGWPSIVTTLGGTAIVGGTLVYLANMLVVIRGHSPHSIPEVLFGYGGSTACSRRTE